MGTEWTHTTHKWWERQTKKPTGLKITRSGGKFTASWKIAEPNYDDGQWYKVALVRPDYYDYTYTKEIGKKATSKVINTVKIDNPNSTYTFRLSDFYPSGSNGILTGIRVKVAGNRQEIHEKTTKTVHKGDDIHHYITIKDHKYTKSDYAEHTFAIWDPAPPEGLHFTLTDSTRNAGTFSWSNSSKNDSTGARIFVDFQAQTQLKVDWDWGIDYAGGLTNWSAAYTGTGTSKSFTEGNLDQVYSSRKKSYTRLFRIRSRGPGGWSAWKYSKYVYAIPYDPYLKTGTKAYKDQNTWRFKVWFHVANTYDHPVDTVNVEYLVGTPSGYDKTNTYCKMTPPVGSSYTSGPVVKYKPGDENYACDFTADVTLSQNQCIWVRVRSIHGPFDQVSLPRYVKSGGLTQPSNLEYTATSASYVNVTATNTAASSIPKSFLAVYIQRKKDTKFKCIGVLTNPSDTSQHGQPLTKTLRCPNLTNTEYKIGVRAFVGTYTSKKVTDYVGSSSYQYTEYAIASDYSMSSSELWGTNDTIASPPDEVTVEPVDKTSVRLSWNWPWKEADACVLSWAKKENAWESTEQPSTYDVASDNHKITSWVIDGLEEDTVYYFRVKLVDTSESEERETDWSEVISYDMSAANNMAFSKPILGTNKSDYNQTETVYLSVGSDTKSEDVTYSIAEWDTDNNRVVTKNYGSSNAFEQVLVTTIGSHQMSITMDDVNTIYAEAGLVSYMWTTGSEHRLVARVTGPEGTVPTEWSEPIPIHIIDLPPVPTITLNSPSFTTMTIQEDIDETTGDPITRTVTALTQYPIDITIGNTEGYACEVLVERAVSCIMARPDERKEELYDGDIIAAKKITGDGNVTIEATEISAILDDGMNFRVRVILTDNYGQNTENEQLFESHFSHQPVIPEATVVVDNEAFITKITATAPENVQAGDYYDIYRLSLDRPELIYKNAQYGITYVDPYPTFGDKGGHRLVAKTVNNDWTTNESMLAWLDLDYGDGDFIDKKGVRIDFEDRYVDLPFNVTFSNSWTKDFKRTTYLGGSVHGDWNPAVTRDLSIETVGVTVIEGDSTDMAMRRLADYPGICHVRTGEGSSFSADVQVSENRSHDKPWYITWSLSIKKVDAETEDGMSLEEWDSIHSSPDTSNDLEEES